MSDLNYDLSSFGVGYGKCSNVPQLYNNMTVQDAMNYCSSYHGSAVPCQYTAKFFQGVGNILQQVIVNYKAYPESPPTNVSNVCWTLFMNGAQVANQAINSVLLHGGDLAEFRYISSSKCL